jgi:UDP-glucose 4-epimerase
MYEGRRVCVTGGAGFIGSHLCDALLKHGAAVSVIDDLSNGDRENLDDRIKLTVGSILDKDALGRAVAGAEVIFHQAAVASVPRSVEEPEQYHEINTTGTMRVLEAARAAGAQRVVFASSSSVYGDQPALPKHEGMVLDPLSPYAASKAAGEQYIRAWSLSYGLSAVSLRYFNIFGPRQRPDSPYAAVIPRFAEALCSGKRPQIYGDGGQTRDFTHVANAVQANVLAGATTKPPRGEAVNVATGRPLSVLELLAIMAKQMGVSGEADMHPPRAGDVLHSHATIDLARDLIGYEPVVGFEEGLPETIEYYVKLCASSV